MIQAAGERGGGREGMDMEWSPQGVRGEREGAMDLDGCNGMEAYISTQQPPFAEGLFALEIGVMFLGVSCGTVGVMFATTGESANVIDVKFGNVGGC